MGWKEKDVQQKKVQFDRLSNTSIFYGNFIPYNKNDLHQIQFEEDLRFFIAKELFPLSFVEIDF